MPNQVLYVISRVKKPLWSYFHKNRAGDLLMRDVLYILEGTDMQQVCGV